LFSLCFVLTGARHLRGKSLCSGVGHSDDSICIYYFAMTSCILITVFVFTTAR